MNEEQNQSSEDAISAKGSRQFWQLAGMALGIMGLLLVEEIITWNGLAFVITQIVLLAMVSLSFWQVGRGGKLRWMLFIVLLLSGAYGFLLGGLHLTDPKEAAIDSLCYWLAAAGLVLVGLGGYVIYSFEIDTFLRQMRGKQP